MIDHADKKEKNIARITIVNKSFTKDMLSTVLLANEKGNSAYIYQKICLDSYPSYRDFHGYKTTVNDGDTCLVIKKIGRPFKINDHPNHLEYDIFEIMIKNRIYQIFRYNLTFLPN